MAWWNENEDWDWAVSQSECDVIWTAPNGEIRLAYELNEDGSRGELQPQVYIYEDSEKNGTWFDIYELPDDQDSWTWELILALVKEMGLVKENR